MVSRIRSFSAGLARRYASTALAIVLEKTFDRCAVNRFKRNAAESEPGQEVTGSAPKATDMLAGNPFTNAEIVDERKNDWVEAGQCRGPRKGLVVGS